MKVINYLLGYKNLKIVQDNEMFNFSLDSVLLPNFVTINKKIKVCCNGNANISVRSVPFVPDATDTTAPAIATQTPIIANANFSISRKA